MGMIERVLILQAIPEHPVKAGVTKQDYACEHQPGERKQEARSIKRHCKPFVMNQVIGPRAEAGGYQISYHAQVGSQEQQGI